MYHTCLKPCVFNDHKKPWICYTCDRKKSNGQVPAESFTNLLKVEDIPPELSSLNSLETHLI